MRIRGTKTSSCHLCAHCKKSKINDSLLCTRTNREVQRDSTCPNFSYDIFKYEPNPKLDFARFSKKDFEI